MNIIISRNVNEATLLEAESYTKAILIETDRGYLVRGRGYQKPKPRSRGRAEATYLKQLYRIKIFYPFFATFC